MQDIGQTGCSAGATEPFALRVIGNSMAPEFEDGHVVIVDPAYPLNSGAFAVVDYGGEVILGQYVVEGEIKWLKFLNADYTALVLAPPYEMKGVVIQRAGRRKKDRKHYDY